MPEASASPAVRPASQVLGAGVLAGAFAGAATGAIDALWSWSGASQFVPGLLNHLRFVLFAASAYACAGALIGLVLTASGLVLARLRPERNAAFAWAIALPACGTLMLFLVERDIAPFLANRHIPGLIVAVAIVGTVLALGIAIVLAAIVAYLIGLGASRVDKLGSPVVVGITAVVATAAAAGGWFAIASNAKHLTPIAPIAVVVGVAAAIAGGWIARVAQSRTTAASERAVWRLAIVIAAVPVVGLALVVAYNVATPSQVPPNHVPLVIGSMLITVAACGIATGLTLLISRAITKPLARQIANAGRPAWLRAWLAPDSLGLATAAIGLALVGIGALIGLAITWQTVKLLPLRMPAVAGVAGVLAIACVRPALALAIRLGDRRPLVRRGVWVAWPLLVIALVLVCGNSEGVIKAGDGYTAGTGAIVRRVRPLFDWDRDGYARLLGGGDCDDGDRTVHPGAPEIPDDGIDQNCVGGDATSSYAGEEPAFVGPPATVPKDLRILLITIDTVRADHFGMYGYDRKTSPQLDHLAGEGTVFEHGWAHAPSTRYSMPAILTGRLPLDVRYDYSVNWPGLSPKAITIAERLAPLGFHTGAITNYEYFERYRHFDQGFDEYDNSNRTLHHSVKDAGPEQTSGSSSKEQTDKAIGFVDRNTGPWFLWVHYYDPHYAYEPHAGFDFGSDPVGLYDGEIAYTDAQIGRLFDHLKQTGVYDKTVVVVTGDHGEGFGEHGIDLHGYHLYAAQTKVPLVIRVPGLPARRATTPAGHIDILPTLVDLAGGKPDAEIMGRSLVDVIAGRDRDRMVFQQLSFENNNEKRAGADATCHVIYNVSPTTSWEVYRIDRDPMETEDLSYTGECADSRATFEHWYDHTAIPAGAVEALVPARPAIANPIDADLGDNVRLLACEVGAAKAGEAVDVTWTFEARGAVEPGWKMFVHVQPPNGPFINGDHVPARPFEWWKAGQFIRYTTQIALPRTARGTYTIQTGMFKGGARARVRAKAPVSDDAVTCAKFEVVP